MKSVLPIMPLLMKLYRRRAYAKIMNLDSQMIINGLREQLLSQLVFFVMNLHVRRRSIFLCKNMERRRIMLLAELEEMQNFWSKTIDQEDL